MSPEQGRGLPLDARSDLYALGVLAFEMLTGNVPFNDDNPMTVIQMHLHGAIPPMPETIPYSVQMIVRRAMEKDPARRYQSSGEMMQHCQQVFAELNSGSVSVGGGGVPRTMIAGQNPYPQQYPQQQQQMQQQQMQPQQGFQSNSPQAKTMIAQQSPFAGGQMPQQQQQQSGLAPQQQGGFVQSSPMQKTIVAGMAPPIVGGQMQGMPQGTPGGFPQQQQMQQMQQPGMHGQMPSGPGPNKTILLQPTDGIVSVAQRGGAPMQTRGGPQAQQGASTLFWIVSLVIGVAIGVLGYVIVLQM
jgi:serine/threonine-protein kinase